MVVFNLKSEGKDSGFDHCWGNLSKQSSALNCDIDGSAGTPIWGSIIMAFS